MTAPFKTLATLTFALLAGHAFSASAEDAVSKRELDAKLQYCKTCHGAQGQGFRGALPIPRLAGQQVEYIESQLQAFIDRRRDNPYMYKVAHVMSPELRKAVATYFHNLDAKPTDSAPPALASAGKALFNDGLPDKGVPACASCHGADAKGNGAFPRLAGQSAAYIERQLVNWEKLRGLDKEKPDNSAIMQPVIHGLDATQIKQVAAYLDRLE